MRNEQLPLFSPSGAKPKSHEPEAHAAARIVTNAPLSTASTLAAAITAYHEQMLRQGLSPYTVQAFGGDLNLFRKHIGSNVPLAEITTETLNRFLNWLRYERGVPCKPKSYQRRLTTLKVFFSWLRQTNVIAEDPAAPIAHQPVTSPLPDVLYADQVAKLRDAARQMLTAEKSDARPYLLVALILSTGIKKSEAMALRPSDIDLSDPKQGVLYIRYEDAKKRHKERKLKLSPEFVEALPRYREQYQPKEHLFECTARNLEYVLADLAKMTGLGDTVSFESLRWTCAVLDYQKGMPEDHIRQKLGLSTITWEEAGDRLKRLAGKAL
ncbi:MAG: tyrosine-type recombinase/integrase [Chloroflexota bacterium]|nr:tyrosine-type recombinase/integrase [Chloroflexota bacterium]